MDKLVSAVGSSIGKWPELNVGRGRVMRHHSLHIITKGSGYFEDHQTERKPVGAGSVIFLNPNLWHNFDPNPGSSWDELWVTFTGEEALRRFGRIIPEYNGVFRYSVESGVVETHEELSRVWFYRAREWEVVTGFLLHKLLFELFAHNLGIDYPIKEREDPLVFQARKNMSWHLSRSLRFPSERFAKRNGVSYEHFRKRFKARTSYAPTQYFHFLKMARAKELLIRSDKSVKEIAYSLAFNDEYYFSRWFKQHQGISPRLYKSQNVRYTPFEDDRAGSETNVDWSSTVPKSRGEG